MPDPNKYKDQRSFMDDCMHQVKKVEGNPQDKSVAMCLSMWRDKGKKKNKDGKSKSKCASEFLRELAKKLESAE